MVIIEQLKHNRYQNVDVPSASDLFKSVGKRVADASGYSGDEYLDPGLSKVAAASSVAKEASEILDKSE